jgi:hypothetical protein
VWVLEDGVLAIREVTVAWRREHSVLVSDGLAEGDLLVTSALAAPVAGMPLRDVAAPPSSSPLTASAAAPEGAR